MATHRDAVVLIDIDLWDGSATQTLRLCNFGAVANYDPRLFVPFAIGSRIVADQYGDVLTTSGNNGGTVEFAISKSRVGPAARLVDPDIWPLLLHHWNGRTVRVYEGRPGQNSLDYPLVYTGRVDDLGHDTLRAQVKLADAAIDLDDLIVSELYPDDDTVPESIRSKPKPELRGEANNLTPVLLSDSELGAPFTFQISRRPLDDIMEVRVGGIKWDRVDSDPVAGEWTPDLPNGKFTLGGITQGLDVRADARAIGWADLTTAVLMRQFIEEAGGSVDSDALAALQTAAPYRIGWYTDTQEVNRLDALDTLMTSIVGWWGVATDGRFTAGVLSPPGTADIDLTGVEIETIALMGLLPPAWRIRVEHSRNWGVTSSFADAVIEADKQRWEETGLVAPAWEDASIKTSEKRAVDMAIIKSLVLNETDALAIRDRAAAVFGVSRRLYEAKVWIEAPSLYRTASVDYLMVNGPMRVHGVTRNFGAGATTLNLWG